MATAVQDEKSGLPPVGDHNTDALHYLVISIYELDKIESLIALNPIAETMDLYCSVTFDKTEMLKTRTFLRCKGGNLKIGHSQRFAFQQAEQIPQYLKFSVFDTEMASYDGMASFDFDLRENITPNYSLRETVQFNRMDADATIQIGIDYQYTTPSQLMLQANGCYQEYSEKIKNKLIQMHNVIDPEAIKKLRIDALLKWFATNQRLLFFLRKNWYNEVPLSIENFAQIVAPSYQLTEKHYDRFMTQYNAMCQLFEEGFNAYYDDEFDLLYYNDDGMELGGHNVTGLIHMLWRYVFLKDILLKCQDGELNIYRSYYFVPLPLKIPMALLALLVQIVVTAGIVLHIVDDVERILPSDFDIFIIVGSALVFGFISLVSYSSARAFATFYEHIDLVYAVPGFFIALDYISSIVMPICISLVSFVFLIQSESYSDLALHAFVMVFLVKINHIINVFESDEDKLVIQDLAAIQGYKSPRQVHYGVQYVLSVLLSPFVIFATIWTCLKQCGVCVCRKNKENAPTMSQLSERGRVYSL